MAHVATLWLRDRKLVLIQDSTTDAIVQSYHSAHATDWTGERAGAGLAGLDAAAFQPNPAHWQLAELLSAHRRGQ